MIDVLRSILDGMDAFIYVSDMASDEILFVNDRMKRLFGLGDDVVGKTCWKAFPFGAAGRCPSCPNRRLEADPGASVSWSRHDAGRHYKCVDSVIDWVDGGRVHMQHCVDVTDAVEAQKATLAASERLELALTSSQAGVWELFFDEDRMIYDPVCAKLFGFDPLAGSISVPELIAHCEKVLKSDSSGDFLQMLREKDPYSQQSIRKLRLALPDGTERHVRNSGYTMRDPSGRVRRVTGMCIDITPYVAMEEELMVAKEAAEKASLAKSQFLSNMSHEIRTPMNAIIGMTDIMLDDELNDRQRSYLNDIKISSTALLSLINDILDFSKIEAGKLQLVTVDFDVLQMLENIQSMFSFAAAEKGLFFYMDILDKLPQCLHGDDIRLRQILVNVIGNAVKFTHKGGVTVIVGVDGGTLSFEVTDTGVGIRSEHLANLFSDFVQLDTRHNRDIAGTGLGLSITKNLVAMMNGTISVESEYGKGSVFRIGVPLVRGDGGGKADAVRTSALVEAPEAAVLVVDDNEINLHVASGLLGLFGIACDTASNGWEAVRKASEREYDIVFMDHMMPQLDGVETTRVLREQQGKRDLVIVALTANAVDGVREMLIESQMNDYLSKPIDKLELNRVLRAWLPPEKVRLGHDLPPAAETAEAEPKARDPLSLIGKAGEIDVERGLSHNGGLREVYEQSLRIMARRLPEATEKLLSFMEQNDAKNFTIEVHGLKGSLANLGITRLARAAGELESAAREGGMDFCRERLPVLAEDLEKLHAGLTAALAGDGQGEAAAPEGSPDALRSALPEVRRFLDAFESDSAAAVLRGLAGRDFGPAVNAALRDALDAVEEFDYDRAAAALDGL